MSTEKFSAIDAIVAAIKGRVVVEIKGYRRKGGAVVGVFRSDRGGSTGRSRRYLVSVGRFVSLRRCLSATSDWHGSAFRSSFNLRRVNHVR